MLFDETLGIDMDEMSYAYWAGLLGKATKDLPVRTVYDNVETETYAWTINSDGYPEKVIFNRFGENDKYLFTW